HRQAVHRFQRALDVAREKDRQPLQRSNALFGRVEDHLAQQEQRLLAALALEHVLGTEQPDSLRAELGTLEAMDALDIKPRRALSRLEQGFSAHRVRSAMPNSIPD